MSFNIRFDGDLYTLPAPVYAFVENGWETGYSDYMVEPNGVEVFILDRNEQVLHATICNFSNVAQPPEFCYVTTIRSTDTITNVPLELPGGITRDSSYLDIVNAHGVPDETTSLSSMTFYTYGNDESSILFTMNSQTNDIIAIDVSHKPSELELP